MKNPLKMRSGYGLLLGLLPFVIAALACDGGSRQGQSTPTPTPRFNFAVTVVDRNNNNGIGQATVLLSVANETVDQKVTDDNGQANFIVDGGYYGKSARIYAKSPYYHPADLEISLTTESRKIVQLISKQYPKLDPDPPEPHPPSKGGISSTRTPTPQKPARQLEVIRINDNKTGAIADEQTIDYRFEADENVPLLFTASNAGEQSMSFSVEIYDSQGFPKKSKHVDSRNPIRIPFTPPRTGPYVLRLRGMHNFGTYLIYMQDLNNATDTSP